MDVAALESLVTERTRAIVAVHLYGLPLDLEQVLAVCRRRGCGWSRTSARRSGPGWAGGGSARSATSAASASTRARTWRRRRRRDGHHRQRRARRPGPRPALLRQRQRKVHSELGWNTKLEAIQAIVLHHKLPYVDGWARRAGSGPSATGTGSPASRCASRPRPTSTSSTSSRSRPRPEPLRHTCRSGASTRWCATRCRSTGSRRSPIWDTGPAPSRGRAAGRLAARAADPADLDDPEMDHLVAAVRDFFG